VAAEDLLEVGPDVDPSPWHACAPLSPGPGRAAQPGEGHSGGGRWPEEFHTR
jgi:hypothetical protein